MVLIADAKINHDSCSKTFRSDAKVVHTLNKVYIVGPLIASVRLSEFLGVSTVPRCFHLNPLP